MRRHRLASLGNGTQGHIVVVSTNNTGFVFEFENLAGGAVLTPSPATLNIDFVTLTRNL